MNILIVMPAKDEANYIHRMLNSIAAQTFTNFTCVVVDDGSQDETSLIVEEMTSIDHRFKLIRKQTGELRSGGSKVVRAFYFGYNQSVRDSHDIIMKLDADLELPNNYLDSVVRSFQSNKRLGACGGYCLVPDSNGGLKREQAHWFHIRGALKAYRRECWDEIGGFQEIWNWDGIDTLAAIMKGWEVLNLEIGVVHYRPTSSAYDKFKHAYQSGYESYRLGSGFGLSLFKAIGKGSSSSSLKVFLYYLKGYNHARRNNESLVIDPELAVFIRNFTYKRLIGLKWKKN